MERQDRVDVVLRIIALNANQHELAAFEADWQEQGLHVETRPFFPWTEPPMAKLGESASTPDVVPCLFPWQHLVVQWDGRVVPCCRDYDGELVLGDATEQTLLEIWRGPALQRLREQHACGAYEGNALCARCMVANRMPKVDARP